MKCQGPGCGWLLISGICANQNCRFNKPTRSASRRRPRHSSPATGHRMDPVSIDARPSPDKAAAQRDLIMRALEQHGKLTMEQMEAATGLPVKSITWRISELTTGWNPRVVKLESKAQTKSKAWAYEYALTERAGEFDRRLAI